MVMPIPEITQIINFRDGIKDISTDIKRIIRKYYNNFMPINLTTWINGKFPNRQKLLKLTKEETENIC